MLYVVILLYTAGFTPQYNTPTYTPAWTSAYTQADSQAEKHLQQKLMWRTTFGLSNPWSKSVGEGGRTQIHKKGQTILFPQ